MYEQEKERDGERERESMTDSKRKEVRKGDRVNEKKLVTSNEGGNDKER